MIMASVGWSDAKIVSSMNKAELVNYDKNSRIVKEQFFSRGRGHTSYWRDWSSDVCSSDLSCRPASVRGFPPPPARRLAAPATCRAAPRAYAGTARGTGRVVAAKEVALLGRLVDGRRARPLLVDRKSVV